jgi:Arc/MetJ-type ribon-helix-helix transcriptional regulator
VLLGSREVVRESVRDILNRPQPLAHAIDELLRGRRVRLGRGEECDRHVDGLLERHVDESRSVLLVPVSA